MKTILALAALFGSTIPNAHAQEGTTLYGNIGAAVSRTTDIGSAGDAALKIGSVNTYDANTLGIKGEEKIGTGLRVHYQLESGFNIGNGALDNAGTIFNRMALIGVETAWGDIDLGRQHTVAYKVMETYDALQYKYPQLSLSIANSAGQYDNNSIHYASKIGSTSLLGSYALNESGRGMYDATTRSAGVLHRAGPIILGGAYTDRRDGLAVHVAHGTIGAAYERDGLRLSIGGLRETTEQSAFAEQKTRTFWTGLSYAATPALSVTGAWYRTKTDTASSLYSQKDVFSVSGSYSITRRTNIYTIINQNKLEGPSTNNQNDRPVDIAVGINHSF